MQLSVRGLAVERGGRIVFSNLDLDALPGRCLTLTGPNGTGKSSLLRAIAGLSPPLAGTIAFARAGLAVDPDEARTGHLHLLGHLDAVKPQLSVREALLFWAAYLGASASPDAAAGRAGLARQIDLPCRFLSAGQRRRLALARLVLAPRALWLLDEPTASLDADGRALVADLIAGHCAGGGTAIAATHEPVFAGADNLALGAAA